ncbi:amidohydrolase family protein [Pseudodesulfovibrio sediminis]|uniref:Amidohydrolase n=1 Tax=Pseudodesulfovibrio sediminis TaxID=2810563 RepID=A0ABM7P375_9BACT|nr:amidohydrolase family protein [Pseudodesulfovibrio sediminis]BCS87282.1 amidohydrolase [Pseudodesulfovibrio sediminis]
MRIDVHTHAFHPKIAPKVLTQLEGHYGISPVGTGIADDLVAKLDKAGLDKGVVLTAATSPGQVIPANNWAIELKENNPRFIPFGTLHPGFTQNEAELDRLERNGIKGLKFHPDFQGYRMDDKALYEVMEMVQDRFICLFHVGDTLTPEENPSCPKKMAALRKAFPKPPMIAAHMGGYRHWEYALKHLTDLDVYVDCSSMLDFVDDTLLKRLFSSYSQERILFGSDYPLFDAETELKQLSTRLAFSDSQIEDLVNRAGDLFD